MAVFSSNGEKYKEAQQIKQDAQKMKEGNLKIMEKMQLRKILQEDISGKTGFDYMVAMELKKDAATQFGNSLAGGVVEV